ncbi:EpsD family peptidyl-prolyl cis-trans isomerase [Thiomicrorhabdus sp.]|uniref:EpsD family peptidyl-prolyl cis-trans isomerase n=1 Tax=Thiomicrorhabdus sp. TaxID=2039724 RepID=UPI0035697F81
MGKVKSYSVRSLILGVFVLLQACGQDGAEIAQKTQLVADVNGSEITVHQLNFAMSREKGSLNVDNQSLANKVLESLINQELIVSEAEGAEIEHDPSVLMALEFGKRQVLVEAYIDRALQAVAPPTDKEVETYFKAHPKIFNERKVFAYSELVVSDDDAKLVDDALKGKKLEDLTLEELRELLNDRNIKFIQLHKMTGAEQLTPEMIELFFSPTLQFDVLFKSPENNHFYQVHTALAESIELKNAKPIIKGYLYQEKKRQALDSLVKKLRERADISYFGDFNQLNHAESKM